MLAHPCVRFVLPFCIHIPDGMYDAIVDKQRYQIGVVFLTNKETPYTPMTSGGRWEIHHDAFGRTGNTELSVVFSTPMENPELGVLTKPVSEISIEDNQILDQWRLTEEGFILTAVKVSNRLLEVYRDQDANNAGEPSFHIFPITEYDISNVRFCLLDQDYKEVFQGGLRPYFKSSLALSGRAHEVIQNVKNFLLSDAPIPIWRILLRHAQNWLWRADYRLVPVEMNTAFEIVSDEMLTRYVGLMSYQKDISRLNFLDKLILIQRLSNDYRKISGKPPLVWAPSDNRNGWDGFLSVQGRQEIAAWYQHCYLLRNEAVHKGLVVKKTYAETAILVTEAAIEFLRNLGK